MSEVEEALLDLLGDEKVVLELLPPTQANPDNVAVVRPREIAHGLQEAVPVDSRPAEPHLPAAENPFSRWTPPTANFLKA